MTNKYQGWSAVTKRWAFPIAAILLPGGFVVLAFSWVYKIIAANGRCANTGGVAAADGVPDNKLVAIILKAARPRWEFAGGAVRPPRSSSAADGTPAEEDVPQQAARR